MYFMFTFLSYDLRFDVCGLYFGGCISISFWECWFLRDWSWFFDMNILINISLLVFMMLLGFEDVILWIELCENIMMVFNIYEGVWKLDLHGCRDWIYFWFPLSFSIFVIYMFDKMLLIIFFYYLHVPRMFGFLAWVYCSLR